MASEAVLKYLSDTNRPYSCADITVNLRGAYTKTAIQKALDALSEAGKIRCKLYGKQKVYVALQIDNVQEVEEGEDYDTQLKNIGSSLCDRKSELKNYESKLKDLLSTPTTESTKVQINDIKEKIRKMEEKLETLRNTTEVLSAEEKNIILNNHEKFLKEYRKRKRIFSDILEAVLEGYPKSKKNFLEEFCIETDEMVDFRLINS